MACYRINFVKKENNTTEVVKIVELASDHKKLSHAKKSAESWARHKNATHYSIFAFTSNGHLRTYGYFPLKD